MPHEFDEFTEAATEAFRSALEELRRTLERARYLEAEEVREPGAPIDEPAADDDLGDPRELGERAALLALAETAWRRHLGSLLDTHQVQALLGVATRQAVSDRARRGGLLMLPTRAGRVLYPAFQFGPSGQPFPAVPKVLAVFEEAGRDPWAVASWLRTPQDDLQGRSPAEWMGHDLDEAPLLEAARRAAARRAPGELGDVPPP